MGKSCVRKPVSGLRDRLGPQATGIESLKDNNYFGRWPLSSAGGRQYLICYVWSDLMPEGLGWTNRAKWGGGWAIKTAADVPRGLQT